MVLRTVRVLEVASAFFGREVIEKRAKIEAKGAAPNIPPKANRRWKNCFSPVLYRDASERMFGRITDLRRIATRYDRLARNFLAALCLVATVRYRL